MITTGRRTFLKEAAVGVAFSSFARAAEPAQSNSPKPNILWITCEDINPHLGCYGYARARTPNLDRMASEGVRYTHAFSVSGVCAPSRSCLITGMYPTTLGTYHMRCNHTPPPHVRCFPAYLRREGYYCTNNVKTDYQFDVPPDAWDDCSNTAHWRNRPQQDKPFFSVFNFTISHESSIGDLDSLRDPLKTRLGALHDPAGAELPPYYPDTEIVRKHWAHYEDVISAVDVQAGDILKQIEEDGLADNTLVFFFGDNGAGLPRAKRWMYDAGIHVPLLVRWPGHVEPGTVSDRLVSFLDFAPTVLSAAGVPIPGHMQGVPFLGHAAGPARTFIFAARDRMDERYDIIRAVRDHRFKYIRNYEPERPYAQPLSYCESWPVMQEMRRVEKEGKLGDAAALFFRPEKPIEEFYDVAADPHETNNLAGHDSEFRDVLVRMRSAMNEWQRETRDLGCIVEPELDNWLAGRLPDTQNRRFYTLAKESGESQPKTDMDKTVLFGKSMADWLNDLNGNDPLARVWAAKIIVMADPEPTALLFDMTGDHDPNVAYWAAVGIGCNGTPGKKGETSEKARVDRLAGMLRHENPTVRLGAARGLASMRRGDLAAPAAIAAMQEKHFAHRLLAVQILEQIGTGHPGVEESLKAALNDKEKYIMRVATAALGLPPVR